ncbi:cbb3-type cytochrome c oxidase subunit I [Pelagicoccus sp. SDUM812003]|uniref:cbb3-type cytochrome c oxidase subunit I n=1 Tax=Pelagicoccus sp. SDUM812003 TaxID=3041267 RepID=UPI00280C6BAC|nr:cbb3-type cytochrome c oxidase subunit I [Pelagicoccus sp. SDUM812003]MDQ8202980.1 cbb3-type cytochrome c oxidase subunit I [Pelagicoccus sp. SDUM812003]
MNLICNLFSSLFPTLEGSAADRDREQAIDSSIRFAVLGLVKGSVFWLLISSVLGLVVSIKLHSPDYLGDSEFLTYGKVYPAFWNALVFGWLFNAGLACCAWILARLSGRPSGNSGLLAISSGAWNVAVVIGLIGIFRGELSPYRMLEFPSYAAPFLFAAFGGIGLWIVLTFKARAYRSAFASQWYALAGVFSFVWIYTVAQVMIFCLPAQGVFQAVVASWFKGNLFGLVIAPFAFATIYYLIPKALGQHIVGYRQAGIAFWSWIIFSSCSGLAALVSGPFPAWVASVGVVASFGLFLPITIFSMQFLSSLLASFSKIWDTISIRYIFYGVVALIASTLLIIVGSLRSVQDTVQFSQFDDGVRFLFLAGFAGMSFMGALYYILPRLLNKELASAGLADLQFWVQGLSIFVIALCAITGGIAHGSLLNGSTADAVAILQSTQSYLVLATIGYAMFLCGSMAYVVSFTWMLLAPRSEKEKSADLIKSAPELEYTPL